ncbi:MAG: bifunctional folylpolyglutamate synthase/dihydrofolate synthase [Alphaproteobacteria bacterium]|nr:bifunctional folylpolyglutamate synthase/dihydrofolate synthase [Alphaproteobacteria bacterium]
MPSIATDARAPDDSAAILARMLHLHPKVIDLSLERMTRLLQKLGNPHLRLPPVIHVAGTNGKGSTVAFMRAMLECAGLRVHVYISPHLQRFHERIRLAGELISEPELCARLLECERVNAGDPITFFEITTVAAFLAFAAAPADILLLEVGMGGRLDTTNIIPRAEVTVITPVDMDHQQFLGETLEEIAAEKAGILKPGTPAIIAHQKPAAAAVIEARAASIGAPLLVHGQDWMSYAEHGRMIFQYADGLLDLPVPGLAGQHQIGNAGAAIAAVMALSGFRIGGDAIAAGLRQVEWPARLQKLTAGPLYDAMPAGSELWLDGAHNPAAAIVVASALAEFEERHPMPLYLVCGMLTSKDAEGFFAAFKGLARGVFTVAIPDAENSVTAEALAEQAGRAGLPVRAAAGLAQALQEICGHSAQPPRVVICGSLYLAGHVLGVNANRPQP